jgi:hypothetical protein
LEVKGMARKDDEDYLRRAAEIDRRIADGESITDIMRSEQRARGEAQIREITAQNAADADTDPVAAVNELGAIWSDDIGAYATGKIDAAQITCALCMCAPCRCPEFGTPAYFALVDARHGRNRKG